MFKKFRILHYVLGFPPNRTGGLVSYTLDLMNQQVDKGHEVFTLYPGFVNLFNRRTYIKKKRVDKKLKKYELVNSLPLALMGGIKEPEDFQTEANIDIFLDFLKEINPDVIHVHTLMGIHKEFFQAAKLLKIKIVFTSHDYFGLAPEPNFFTLGNSYDDTNSLKDWSIASQDAYTTKKLLIFQLRIYPVIRKMKTIISLLKYSKSSSFKSEFDGNETKYISLKNYYLEIFKLIDGYHFNSNLAKEVFLRNLDFTINYKVISITNSNIKNNEKRINLDKEKTRIAYIGPDKTFKGFDDFLKLAKMNNGNDLEYHTFGYEPSKEIKNIIQHGKFKRIDISEVYESFDILIVPSKWKETFGLIVLEALSFGKIVFVSKNVGASDIVDKKYIFTDMEDLSRKLKNRKLHTERFEKNNLKTIDFHTEEIINLYGEV